MRLPKPACQISLSPPLPTPEVWSTKNPPLGPAIRPQRIEHQRKSRRRMSGPSEHFCCEFLLHPVNGIPGFLFWQENRTVEELNKAKFNL